ncbi:MAG: hypothetical protein IPN78_19170 [Candidatus Accumulibacter sp.]|nr:hypothetical protein [Candidatus Accumulibacter propinquus]
MVTSRARSPLRKTIYSLIDLREILLGCNRRYLEYLSALDDFSAGDRNLHRLVNPKTVNGHTLKGFNFFDATQQALLRALQRPEFNIRGIRRADLVPFFAPDPRRPASRASFGACASSTSSRRSFMAIATTSPVWAARPSPPLVESLNKPSSRLSPTLPRDQICSGNVKI